MRERGREEERRRGGGGERGVEREGGKRERRGRGRERVGVYTDNPFGTIWGKMIFG